MMLGFNKPPSIERHSGVRLLCCIVLCAACVVALAPRSARAAAPWILIVHGERLDQPVIVADIYQNGEILGSPVETDRDSALDDRPYLEVALFWGPRWLEFIESGQSPETLTPDQANQYGRFYPSVGEDEAVLILAASSPSESTPASYRPSQEGLQILQEQGVPVSLDTNKSGLTSMLDGPVLWGIGITLILLAGSVLVAYLRDPARKLQPSTRHGVR